MLSPLDALGAAAAAIQFVDFSITLLSKSREIYSSASGTTPQTVDLTVIQTSLVERSKKIKDRISPIVTGSSTAKEDEITLALCNRCLDISTELEIVLSAIRFQGPNTKWKSVRSALKSMWRKGTIETLKCRLLEMRATLDSHVMTELPSQIDFLALKQAERFDQLDLGVQKMVAAVVDAQGDLNRKLDQQNSQFESSIIATTGATRAAIESARAQSSQDQAAVIERLNQLDERLEKLEGLIMRMIQASNPTISSGLTAGRLVVGVAKGAAAAGRRGPGVAYYLEAITSSTNDYNYPAHYDPIHTAAQLSATIEALANRLRRIEGTVLRILPDQCKEMASRLDVLLKRLGSLRFALGCCETIEEVRRIQTLQRGFLETSQTFETAVKDFEKQHVQEPAVRLSRILATNAFGRRTNVDHSESHFQEALVDFSETLSKQIELTLRTET